MHNGPMNDAERLAQVQQLMTSVQNSIAAIQTHLEKLSVAPTEAVGDSHTLHRKAQDLTVIEDGRVLEGVFDGQNMIGPDARHYPVPANYASKSKLVEGDVMKLTIDSEGRFRYKQIAPITRKTVVGTITKQDGEWRGLAEGKYYKILLASVTFYHAEEGDQVTLILPSNRDATWGAVDNIVKQGTMIEGSSEEDDMFSSDSDSDDTLYPDYPADTDLLEEDGDLDQLSGPESAPELDTPEAPEELPSPAAEPIDEPVLNPAEHADETLENVAERMTSKQESSQRAKEDEFALM